MALPHRDLQFPPDPEIGRHYVRPIGSQNLLAWENFGPAMGDVTVSEGLERYLVVHKSAVEDLTPLSDLRPDDLCCQQHRCATTRGSEGYLRTGPELNVRVL